MTRMYAELEAEVPQLRLGRPISRGIPHDTVDTILNQRSSACMFSPLPRQTFNVVYHCCSLSFFTENIILMLLVTVDESSRPMVSALAILAECVL